MKKTKLLICAVSLMLTACTLCLSSCGATSEEPTITSIASTVAETEKTTEKPSTKAPTTKAVTEAKTEAKTENQGGNESEQNTKAPETSAKADDKANRSNAMSAYLSLFKSVSNSSINASSSDMIRGLLILVNNNHKFALGEPEDIQDMIDIPNRKYTIAYDYLDGDRFTLKEFGYMTSDFYNKYNEKLQVCSGYRTIATQKRNFENSVAQVGEAETLKWYTRPGYSEHHTGLAIDFNTDSFGAAAFTGKGNQRWYRGNCYHYGFIHRFAKEKKSYTGVNEEAWHFRQVGIPHAVYIKEHDYCLEEYVEHIKEFSFDSPATVDFSGKKFYIWYVKKSGDSTKIELSGYKKYLLSGNNYDGFIVTAIK